MTIVNEDAPGEELDRMYTYGSANDLFRVGDRLKLSDGRTIEITGRNLEYSGGVGEFVVAALRARVVAT